MDDALLSPADSSLNGHGQSRRSELLPILWLCVFTTSGIGLGCCFELLDTHAGPAKSQTFFLAFVGYWAQFFVSGLYVLSTGSWRGARWSRPAVIALVLSAIFDGAAQAMDYVGQMEGGYTLFTIFHSSVTLFACLLAYVTLRARPTPLQWAGAVLIVAGLLTTAFPHPISARESFNWAFVFSLVGSFCLAASYPTSELVFRYGGDAPVSEELGCFCGCIFNVVAFSIWTAAYTVPRWEEVVIAPIHGPNVKYPCSNGWCVAGYYLLFGLMVGLHSLSFWKSVYKLGTVATAVSKGAQQSGIFIVAHIFFCSSDPYECLWNNGPGGTTWSKMQKPIACAVCVAGVVIFVLGKKRDKRTSTSPAPHLAQLEEAERA